MTTPVVIPTLPHLTQVEPIEYPESDGKPVAETQAHFHIILTLVSVLREYFRRVRDVFIAGNLMFYFEEGRPTASISPDIFVVRGLDKRMRRVYKLWEEGRAPNVVFEITSKSTLLEDKGNKRAVYATIGVQEYFLFDPLSEYLKPPLQGFRLLGDEYERIAPASDGSLLSEELGLRLVKEGDMLRLIEATTGKKLLTPDEAYEKLAQNEAEEAEEGEDR